jgi:general secretion pathway protein N
MMARRRSGWLVSTLLLGVCVALAAFVYDQVRMEALGPAPSGGGETPPLAALPDQPSYAMAPVEDFSMVLERPLFSPTRRPPPAGTVAAVTSEPELQLTLVGVIISSEEQIAIVRLQDASRFVRLSVGDSFQGWMLDSIEPSRITFRRGDVEEHIELTYDMPPPVQKPKRRKRRERKRRNQDPDQLQPQLQPGTQQD